MPRSMANEKNGSGMLNSSIFVVKTTGKKKRKEKKSVASSTLWRHSRISARPWIRFPWPKIGSDDVLSWVGHSFPTHRNEIKGDQKKKQQQQQQKTTRNPIDFIHRRWRGRVRNPRMISAIESTNIPRWNANSGTTVECIFVTRVYSGRNVGRLFGSDGAQKANGGKCFLREQKKQQKKQKPEPQQQKKKRGKFPPSLSRAENTSRNGSREFRSLFCFCAVTRRPRKCPQQNGVHYRALVFLWHKRNLCNPWRSSSFNGRQSKSGCDSLSQRKPTSKESLESWRMINNRVAHWLLIRYWLRLRHRKQSDWVTSVDEIVDGNLCNLQRFWIVFLCVVLFKLKMTSSFIFYNLKATGVVSGSPGWLRSRRCRGGDSFSSPWCRHRFLIHFF